MREGSVGGGMGVFESVCGTVCVHDCVTALCEHGCVVLMLCVSECVGGICGCVATLL